MPAFNQKGILGFRKNNSKVLRPFFPNTWELKDTDFQVLIADKEANYMPNPQYFETCQTYFKPSMRCVLLDWVFELSSEFNFKKQTVYLAISIVDRLCSVCPNVLKNEIQLLGLTALYISSKLEEVFPPSTFTFAKAAKHAYPEKLIKQSEKAILKHLNWRVLSVTPYEILNWLMDQWDNFICFHFFELKENSLFSVDPNCSLLLTFKKPNKQSYKRYTETMQVLDTTVLDHRVLRFLPKHLVSAVLYLQVNKYFQQSALASVKSCEENNWVIEEIFSEFISKVLGVSLIHLHQEILFASQFLNVEKTLEVPKVCKVLPKERIEEHYEEFQAYQVYNKQAVSHCKKL